MTPATEHVVQAWFVRRRGRRVVDNIAEIAPFSSDESRNGAAAGAPQTAALGRLAAASPLFSVLGLLVPGQLMSRGAAARLVVRCQRKLDEEGSPRGRAAQRHRPAERVDPVPQAEKS
jgi:hypothetical protein